MLAESECPKDKLPRTWRAVVMAVAVWHMCRTMFAGISPLPDDVFMHFARLVVCLVRWQPEWRAETIP